MFVATHVFQKLRGIRKRSPVAKRRLLFTLEAIKTRQGFCPTLLDLQKRRANLKPVDRNRLESPRATYHRKYKQNPENMLGTIGAAISREIDEIKNRARVQKE